MTGVRRLYARVMWVQLKKIIPPCNQKRVFTAPIFGHPATIAAMEMCATCPLRKQCAKEALTAGATTDKHVQRPASDVIQAGVFCTGDHRTARELAVIAGCEMPKIYDSTPRYAPPAYCKHCKKIMVKWQRNPDLKPGEVMHYARGYCTNCRGAYTEERARTKHTETPSLYANGRQRGRLDKPTPAGATPHTTQMELF